jgi:hypothetical protein
MSRLYIAVRFRETDRRTWTYHYDGDEQIMPGQTIRVQSRDPGGGWVPVIVKSVSTFAPRFATKPVMEVPSDGK